MKIVELKKAMDARFEQVDARFEQVDARFAQVDAHFETLETRLATEHETTRRHMEMLVDQLKAEYRVGFDRMLATDQRLASLDAVNTRVHGTIAAILDDHELRIKALEPRSTPPDSPPAARR
jgi:septal ring factor EnvC (AmiA/AmiB activator)